MPIQWKCVLKLTTWMTFVVTQAIFSILDRTISSYTLSLNIDKITDFNSGYERRCISLPNFTVVKELFTIAC